MSNEDEIVKLREKYEELEKKVISLESEVKVLKDNSFNQVQNREQEQKIGHNYVKQNTNTIKEEPAIGKQEQKIESNYTPKTKNTNNIQVETKIGKQVMSIIASVLIFFSLILFARVIYTYLTDGMKVAFMYLLSIGFLSLGLVKMNKQNKYYLLFTSIAGCGIGALYISNVISYFIFHILNKYVLFFLIFVWIVGVAYLSTKKSQVFMIICYIGILLSTLLCIIDNYKSILAIVCYLLGISILFIFNYSKNINRDIFYFIQYPIVIAVISLVYYNQLGVNIFIAVTVLSLYIWRNYLYKETPKDYCILTLLLSIGTLILNTSIVYVNWERIQSNFFVWVISLVLVVWSIYKYNRGLLAKIPYYIVIVLLPLLPYGDIYINYVLYIPFIILYLVLGYIGKSFTTRLIGVIYVILYAINYPSKTPMIVAYSIIFIALVSYVIYTYVYSKNENIKDKYVIFIGFLSILLTLNNDIERELLFIAYVLLSIYINSSYFKVKEVDKAIGYLLGGIYNIICMLCGTINIYIISKSDIRVLVIYILCTLVLYMINTFRLFKRTKHEMLVGIYIGLKLTFLMTIILSSLESTGVFLSILFLLFAIISIIVGFKTKHKSLRVYGLVLSMIAVIKLVLLDISYENNLYRPLGFFIAGVLCFGISFIYSKLEKQVVDKEG